MILGLDISTQRVGLAILDEETKEILLSDRVLFRHEEKSEYILVELEERVEFFEEYLKKIAKSYRITNVIIEAPFISFQGGGGSAQTTSKLLTINGMIRYMCYKLFGVIPQLISVNSARKRVGIDLMKKTLMKDKKKQVAEFVKEYYKNTSTPFEFKLTKHNNLVKGEDDRADSIVIALSYFYF